MGEWAPIPGETPIDPSGLRDPRIRTRRELNEAEGRNIADVVFKYLIAMPTPEMAPFNLSWTLSLHREMFGKVWDWAGTLRKVDLNLGVPWPHVETQIYSLLLDLPHWSHLSLVEQAARLHHGAVRIHPFLNGNGRWSRMLANIWLKLHDGGVTVWPEESVGQTSVIREEYLQAIQQADLMNYVPLIALHERFKLTDFIE
jgi:fido (protein-threonine AMPylation protein)